VLDLEQELDGVLRALEQHDIAYAICGGIAMAIHGHPRATIDIDLLIRPEDEEPVYAAVAPLGFQIRARPMEFDGGQTQIRRVTKIDPADGETLMLDLLLVTPKHEPVWQSRETWPWRGRSVSVVSAGGLIALKSSRGSKQDLADIERLNER
jgi:hypothetical protein